MKSMHNNNIVLVGINALVMYVNKRHRQSRWNTERFHGYLPMIIKKRSYMIAIIRWQCLVRTHTFLIDLISIVTSRCFFFLLPYCGNDNWLAISWLKFELVAISWTGYRMPSTHTKNRAHNYEFQLRKLTFAFFYSFFSMQIQLETIDFLLIETVYHRSMLFWVLFDTQ